MDSSEFRMLALDSAQMYLRFLEQNNKGLSSTPVDSITKRGKEVFLHLRGRLSPAGLDDLVLRIDPDEYRADALTPVEYLAERSILVLRPKKELRRLLPEGPCKNISVISDLRFLVHRVYRWYQHHDEQITLPEASPDVEPPSLEQMEGGAPTDDQYSAVRSVLTSPFSYVWGAPGTGKTRFVLANCVLAYLRQGKQVLLTAPTNNALEQMLSGVLEVLTACGIPASHVHRLGIPSAGFAAKYPDACDQRSVESRKATLTARLDKLRRQREEAKQYHFVQGSLTCLKAMLGQVNEASAQFQRESVPERELYDARTENVRQAQKADRLERTVNELTIWMESFPGRLSRFFRPALYSKKSALLDSTAQELEDTVRRRTAAAQRLEDLETAAREADQRYHEQLKKTYIQYGQYSQFFTIPSIPNTMSVEEFLSFLQRTYDEMRAEADQLPRPDNKDVEDLEKRIASLEAELDTLNAGTAARWEQVQVWAMTVDRFISDTLSPTPAPGFDPAHVFMDEAAYCSLIKGYTLLSLGRPVTLLGDHAQLPPVCEMGEHDLRVSFRPEFLWAQSTIHLDAVFHRSAQELHDDYKNTASPCFSALQMNALSITHRFGPGLSRILSEHIYAGALTSAKAEETDIRYIHAPADPSDLARTSKAECDAICRLADRLSSSGANFAILTPYKKQVVLLSKARPNLAAMGRIMTIHAAQGREFHTVILSVVDTSNKFFTNSSHPIGRAVLNTAVSRVRSDLILVLDYDYWHTQRRQIIGQLLQIAKPC